MNRRHDDEPILITEARQSSDEEFSARKKRYSIIMACRIPCLLLAGVFGIAFNLPLVAVLFIVLSVPLPWVAVLIANDRTPVKAGKVNKYQHRATRIQNHDRKLIEAAEALDARDGSRRAHEGRAHEGRGADGRGFDGQVFDGQVVDAEPPRPGPTGNDSGGDRRAG